MVEGVDGEQRRVFGGAAAPGEDCGGTSRLKVGQLGADGFFHERFPSIYSNVLAIIFLEMHLF